MSSQAANPGVLVGVDGSRSSKRAVQWAAHEARMRNVPLTLVHVVVTPSWGPAPWLLSNAPLPLPAEEDPELEKSGRKIIADAIKIAEESTRETGHPEINSELFFSVPVPTLVGLSKEARIIVVGRRGRHRLRGVLLGSVSTGLIHHAHCPVAVIGDAAPIGPKDSRRPVVVGIDGSSASELATEIAFDEASRRRVDLVAMHAWRDQDLSKGLSMEWSAQQSIASKNLAERLAGGGNAIRTSLSIPASCGTTRPIISLMRPSRLNSSSLAVTAAAGSQGWSWDQSVRPLHMLPAFL